MASTYDPRTGDHHHWLTALKVCATITKKVISKAVRCKKVDYLTKMAD